MSDAIARSALMRMNLHEVAVAPHYGAFVQDLRDLAMLKEAGEAAHLLRRGELCESFGFTPKEQQKPFAFSDGLAIIPIQGTLINRFSQGYSFLTGYNFVRRQMNMALNDEDVKGIVFDINSYGGEAAGCFELADDIYAARSIKPSIAVVDSNAYSAGYMLASAAGKIALTPSGGAGSIGVVTMHVDMSKMLEDFGVKVTFIHFGDHKVDGNPYEALPEDVKAQIQKSVNATGEKFVELVARNRSMDAKKVKDTEARTYRAEDALSLGLIDTIATPSEAVQVLFDELSGSLSTTARKVSMTTQANAQPGTDQATQEAAAAQAAAQQKAAIEQASKEAAEKARTEERARMQGITGCEEAKGKGKLANHLAMNTNMDVESAKAVLKAAAPEAAAAGPANAFNQAMDNTANPNVGADGGEGSGTQETTPQQRAAQILKNQEAMTGVRLVSSK